MDDEVELTVVMPCLNEAETLGACIRKAKHSLDENQLAGEIIIADNGSTDGSQKIARDLGARVVDVALRGYGSALIGGILAARGKCMLMGDADDSDDFSNIMLFIEKLRAGVSLMLGNRFQGGIKHGAMPRLHRYLSNPVLTGIGRLFFTSRRARIFTRAPHLWNPIGEEVLNRAMFYKGLHYACHALSTPVSAACLL